METRYFIMQLQKLSFCQLNLIVRNQTLIKHTNYMAIKISFARFDERAYLLNK